MQAYGTPTSVERPAYKEHVSRIPSQENGCLLLLMVSATSIWPTPLCPIVEISTKAIVITTRENKLNKRELLLMYGQALAANDILLEILTDTEDDQMDQALRDAYDLSLIHI